MILTEQRPRSKSHRTAAPRMIEPEEYCRLAISLRPLQRCDDRAAGLRMLMDTATGEVFAIEETRLAKYQSSQALV